MFRFFFFFFFCNPVCLFIIMNLNAFDVALFFFFFTHKKKKNEPLVVSRTAL